MSAFTALFRPCTLAALTVALGVFGLGGCASAPPPPPKQVLEYERQTGVGLEKHAQGYIAQARVAFQRALTHAELDDSGERMASALINLGGSELLLDNADEAGRAFGRAIREAKSANAPGLEWQAQNGLAEATRRLGQPAKALELYARRPDPGKGVAENLVLHAEAGRALALADQGQAEAALDLLQQLESAARARPQPDAAWPAILHARARIQLALKRPADALATATSALDKDRALHHPPSVADDHRLLATILASLGRDADARPHRERAATIFAQTGQTARLKALRPDATPAAAPR